MSSPCHTELLLPEEQIVSKPEEEELDRRKDIPEETEEQAYGLE